MLQRGRKSSASLAIPLVDGSLPRLEPPESLTGAEREAFLHLVQAVDPKHFRPSDLPLLCAYVRAIGFEARAAAELAQNPADTRQLALWEKSSRAMVALSQRLRLCPQSRLHPHTVDRRPERVRTPPWE